MTDYRRPRSNLLWFVIIAISVLLLLNRDALLSQEQFSTMAATTLATAIDTDDTSVVVSTGTGSEFPTCCTGSQDFYIVVQSGTTWEAMRVTNRSTDTLTVVRNVEGTNSSFGIGSRVEQRVIKSTLDRLRDLTVFGFTAHGVLVSDGSQFVRRTVPNCNQTTEKLVYDTSDQAWECHPDQGGSGAGLTRIAGNSGAAGADFTVQVLTSNCAANSTTSLATCMTTTSVGAGTWLFSYQIVYQSSATTTGVGFAVNHTGTTGTFVSTWRGISTGGAAATGVFDQLSTVNTGQMMEGKSERVKNTVSSASAGVDTLNANMHAQLDGVIVVTVSGSLEFRHSSETANSTQVMAGTSLQLIKVN